MKHERTYVIYCYTNKITGKKYIGQTCTSLEKRAGSNGVGYKCCTLFWRAIQKYGWENFLVEILERGLNVDEANEKEQYWISYFDTLNPENGYNSQSGGKNYEVGELTRQRMVEANTGENNPFFGRNHSDEYKKMMSEKYQGEKAYWYGKHFSEETKRKQSESHMGHLVSEETKQKMREVFKGKVPTQMVQANYKKVQQFTLDGQFMREFDSIKQAEEETQTCHGKISLVCLGKRKSAGGYYWKYTEVA